MRHVQLLRTLAHPFVNIDYTFFDFFWILLYSILGLAFYSIYVYPRTFEPYLTRHSAARRAFSVRSLSFPLPDLEIGLEP